MPTNKNLERNVNAGHNLGWSFTPLTGKAPKLNGWQTAPRETLKQAIKWASIGNVGLRTGTASGVVVIDLDEYKPDYDPLAVAALSFPTTVTARTGGGGRQLYYTHEGSHVGNSVGKIAPAVDIKGDEGQAVFPGSIHPDTKKPYAWIEGYAPGELPLAKLPDNVIELIAKPKYKPKRTRPAPASRNCTKYVQAAIEKECASVAGTAEGSRNDTLNAAAFSLGTLVGGGYVDRDTVDQALRQAAQECLLMADDIESTLATIASGLDAGIAEPRTIEDRPVAERRDWRDKYVLTPGAHKDDHGTYIQQSNYDFVVEVLSSLPADGIYRRDFLPCEIVGKTGNRRWLIIDVPRMMVIVDQHMQLGKWVTSRGGDHPQVMAYQNTNTNTAKILVGHVAAAEGIRDLNLMVSYPVFGPGYVRIKPGWHNGLYYDEPPELRGLNHEHDCEFIHNVLHDLVIDFPFKSETDRQNFFGLLLTPIIAPAIGGDRPMHLINSPLERTGKSKLVNDVWGGVITGRNTPAMQITSEEPEREKRIIAMLLENTTMMHLDNLPPNINSPALSSLLTASVFKGRLLGYSRNVSLPNNLTIVGTGNNVQASGEIAKRLIPILMEPRTAKPEARTDFQHPDLRGYVRENRLTVLSCLLGMVDNWVEAGKPKHTNRLGGFEEWSEAIGGILKVNGMSKWRTNEEEWREIANPHGTEIKTFVEIWFEEFGSREVTAKELMEIAEVNGVFLFVFARPGMAAQGAAFGKLMTRYVDAPIGEHRIRRRQARQKLYKLEAIDEHH